MKKETGMPYGMICKALQIPTASFKRWRSRIHKQVAIFQRPGPKKVEPFDPCLETEIQRLDHGRRRSVGTTGLYQRYRSSVSRRELGRMVERVRRDLESDRR